MHLKLCLGHRSILEEYQVKWPLAALLSHFIWLWKLLWEQYNSLEATTPHKKTSTTVKNGICENQAKKASWGQNALTSLWSRDKHWRAHRHRSCSSHNTTNQLPSAKLHSHSQESKGLWIRCLHPELMISVGPNCSFCYIDPHVCMCQSRMSRSCPCHRTSWELAKVVASQFSQCLREIVVSIHFYHCKQVWYLSYQFLRHNSPYQDQATMPLTNSRKMGSTTFNSTWSWTSRVATLWYQGNWVCW